MRSYKLKVNNQEYSVDVDFDMPLLWVLRDFINLKGTKFGCGIGQCGSCTIHINGIPVRSCIIPISDIGNKNITTIEGLSKNGNHAIQDAWKNNNVPQCGYCQSGQIMSAVAFLNRNPNPTDSEIDNYMSGNICRCGTYPRIKKAIKNYLNDN